MASLENWAVAVGVVFLVIVVLHVVAWRSLKDVAREPYPIRDLRQPREHRRDRDR